MTIFLPMVILLYEKAVFFVCGRSCRAILMLYFTIFFQICKEKSHQSTVISRQRVPDRAGSKKTSRSFKERETVYALIHRLNKARMLWKNLISQANGPV